MTNTYTFTAGAAVRRHMRVWIAELQLDAKEFKGTFESSFVVTTRTERDEEAVAALEEHVNDIIARRVLRELREQQAEDAKKLKKVNFWRKATFRKPLSRLA